MKLEDMWRQSDKSYIHPSDMHDQHIKNALKKATAKHSEFFGMPDYAHYTEAEWRCVLRLDPVIEKLVKEGLRRHIIPVQHPRHDAFYPNNVAPLISSKMGRDVNRCFDCGSCNIVIEYLSAPHHIIVRCEVCKVSIQSNRAIEDWNVCCDSRLVFKSRHFIFRHG